MSQNSTLSNIETTGNKLNKHGSLNVANYQSIPSGKQDKYDQIEVTICQSSGAINIYLDRDKRALSDLKSKLRMQMQSINIDCACFQIWLNNVMVTISDNYVLNDEETIYMALLTENRNNFTCALC